MIIAEVGLNHRGSFDLAKSYVNALIKTDVDAVTFQVREPGFYENEHKDSELNFKEYEDLKKSINDSNKKFGFAICDPRLSLYPRPDFIKILSKDLNNLKFIDKVTKTIKKEPIFLSTGLSSFAAIERALDVISKNRSMKNVRLIHTRLSHSIEDVNLKAILTMKSYFGNIVAFGNHCSNASVLYAACSYEPSDYYFYVKHRLADLGAPFAASPYYSQWQKDKKHPDDMHAIYLDLVQKTCHNLRDIQKALGTGEKTNTTNIIEGQR